jgi:hypothetical protein
MTLSSQINTNFVSAEKDLFDHEIIFHTWTPTDFPIAEVQVQENDIRM